VDRLVIKLVTKRMVSRDGFEFVNGVCQMKDNVRRLYLEQQLGLLTDEVRIGEQKLSWSDTILLQARKLAKFLRGEIDEYEGFWQRW
jgi:CRISPR-associated protein Cas1